MSRKISYFCDGCGIGVEDGRHLNIVNGDLRVSYKNRKNEWVRRKAKVGCGEYHFCNTDCLKRWLDKKVKKTNEEINEALKSKEVNDDKE